jgi:rod shape determining protein RodA
MLVIAGLSIPIIASGAAPYSPTPDYYVERQIVWIILGLITVFVVAAIPYERFKRFAPYVYWGSVAMLLYVVVKGHTALGGQRWIQIGSFQLQPSEFAKIAIIVALAALLEKRETLTEWRDLVLPFLEVGLPMALILKQPDLGTTLVFVAITFGMLFMAGVPGARLLLIFGGGLALVVGWIWAHLAYPHLIPLPIHHYQLQRLLIFLNPNSDPSGAGYNVIQSRIAVGSGGLFGTGLSLKHSTQLSYLPESYTDFIYALVGEELGFVGSIALLFLYLLLIARAMYIATKARDRFGMLLAAGFASLLAFHVLESAGMATGIMPVAGVPLPFLSYGGSAFLADSAGIGILINVYMRRQQSPVAASRPQAPGVYSKENAS